MSLIVRPPAVADTFYPADPVRLKATINDLLNAASSEGEAPKALIVPHAAYQYSGPTAASAYARLANDRKCIRRLVLLGPSHFVWVGGIATSRAEAFATPLGEVPVDRAALKTIASLPEVTTVERAHAREHSLEVQLPFLQVLFPDITIVPMVTTGVPPERIGRVFEMLWGGQETRFLVSSDLSHYASDKAAIRLDRETARVIETLSPDGVAEGTACGREAINGLLWAARQRTMRVETLDLRNSGDTSGLCDAVVGYGAFAFLE